MTDLSALAATLDDAARDGRPLPPPSRAAPGMGLPEAYAVQALALARRHQRGERRAGVRLGLTSRAAMQALGAVQPVRGGLTDAMRLAEGGVMALAGAAAPELAPAATPEIAYVLRRRLHGPLSAAEAFAAIEAVAPAIAVGVSRFQPAGGLADLVADNLGTVRLVVGGWRRADLDVGNLGLVLELDGQPAALGSSAAVLGHPVRGLLAAARLAGEAGGALEAGDIVLSGPVAAAQPLRPGQSVRAEFQDLGAVAFLVAG